MSTPYRTPYPKPLEKRKSAFMSFLKTIVNFIDHRAELFIILGFAVLIFGAIGGTGYYSYRDSEARRAQEAHDEYVLRQEICAVHYGWYAPSANYHGLMACRSLDDHSVFFVIRETGLEVYTDGPDSE